MRKMVIMSDFDGTITVHDVLDRLFSHFGDESTRELERRFRAGELDDRETLRRKFARIEITEQQLKDYVRKEIPVDPAFKRFYERVVAEGIDFIVLSGGFMEYIEALMERENIELEIPVYANRLCFATGSPRPVFLHDSESCSRSFGPCGNCKLEVFEHYQIEGRIMVYIGDGLTDRCVAEEADLIFAKKGRLLEEYCRKQKLTYTSFTDFNELFDIFFADESGL